ncbi:MAG: molybdopterin-binding protein, partial [Lachnospiraceae bacterium]|nr:molybdopterin-binding protein [Lachnospiraceae bacterium]
MTAEIICVGTELLLGNIVNTNAAYMAEQLAGVGISCYYQSVVGDNEERLLETINIAMKRSEVIILSGGLGPTEDDLTKETAAKACKRKLVMHESSRQAIEDYFAGKGITPTENNWKQALIPEGAKVIANANGTAPGIIIEEKNCKLILLPGPPGELIPMFEGTVIDYLNALTPGVIVS